MSKVIISLSRGQSAIIDEADAPSVFGINWHTHDSLSTLYARGRDRASKKQVYMHRIILGAKPGEIVDHINGNGLDNRRKNLRICTVKQNAYNKTIDTQANRHKYRGVFKNGKYLFGSQIKKDRKYKFLGNHKSPALAALAYDIAALEMFGEFSKTNFPKEIISLIRSKK